MKQAVAKFLVGIAVLGSSTVAGTKADDEPAPQVSITYLANEGIMISSGDKSVLVDALFRSAGSAYQNHEPAELERIETAQPPYDGVDLVLVTHYHGDHFNAASVTRYLAQNKNAVLVTSEQVTGEMRKAPPNEFKSVVARIRPRSTKVGEEDTEVYNGIRVEVLGLSHGGGRFEKVRNMGYIVHLGGKRILHVGDAQVNQACFETMKKFAQGVDVACLPHWIVEHPAGASFIRDILKPKHLVVFHIMPREAKRVKATVRKSFPHAICLTKQMAYESF